MVIVTLMLVVVELPPVAVVAVAAAVLVDPADPEDAGCVGMLPGVSCNTLDKHQMENGFTPCNIQKTILTDLAAWPGRTAAGSKHSELIVPICPGRQHNWPAVVATLGSALKGAVIVARKSPQLLSAQAGETVNELKQSSPRMRMIVRSIWSSLQG